MAHWSDTASDADTPCQALPPADLELLGRTSTKVRCAVQLADMVAARAQQGKNYGVVLVPEGLIECVPEVRPARLVEERQCPWRPLDGCRN